MPILRDGRGARHSFGYGQLGLLISSIFNLFSSSYFQAAFFFLSLSFTEFTGKYLKLFLIFFSRVSFVFFLLFILVFLMPGNGKCYFVLMPSGTESNRVLDICYAWIDSAAPAEL